MKIEQEAVNRAEIDWKQYALKLESCLAQAEEERLRLEAELKRTREEAGLLIQHAPTGIYEVDFTATCFKSVNDAMCTMTGYSREELLKMNPFDLLDEAGRKTLTERARKTKAGEPIDPDVEYKVRCKDGKELYAVLNTEIKYSEGKPDTALVIAHNVTERKQAEEELRRSEERYRALIETSPDAIFVHQDTRFIFANAATLELYGAETFEQLREHTVLELIVPEEREAIRERIEQTLNGVKTPRRETQILRLNGGVKTVEAVTSSTEYQGKAAVQVTIRDITERKMMVEALFESEARFRNLANHISQLAWMANEEGEIFWYNQRWLDYTGTTLEEVEGWGWQKLLHPEHVQRVVEKISHSFETGEIWEDIFPLRGENRKYRWFLSRAIPIKDESGRVTRWFGTNTDVTEQRAAEQELRQSQEKLKAALNKMTASEKLEKERRAELEAVLDAVPALTWITHDPQARKMTGNRLTLELMKMGREDNLSKSATDVGKLSGFKITRNGVEVPANELPVQVAARTGQPVRDFEFDLTFDNGELHSLLGNAQPLLDDQGHPAGAVGAFIDITARKKIERQLEEANASLEERVLERTAELDRSAKELRVALENLGNTEEELRVYNEMLLLKTRQQSILAEISQVLAEAGPNAMDVMQIVVKRATEIFGDACLMRQLSEDGQWLNPVAFYANDPDAHLLLESKTVRDTCQPSEDIYAEVFKTGIGKVIQISDPSEWGEKISDPFYSAYFKKYQSTSIMIAPLRIKDKTIGTLSLIRNIPNKQFEDGDLVFLQDLADRSAIAIYNARLFQDLEKAYLNEKVMRRQLIQSEKYSALARLVASVAHEINNPLQTVQNCLYLLEPELEAAPGQEFLRMAISEGKRMSSLVQQLRETYRPSSLQAVDFNLIEVLTKAHELMAPQLRQAQIDWQMESDNQLILIHGIPDQITQVFLNISLNGIDAMSGRPGSRLKVTVSDDRKAGRVRLKFEDNGPGIPPESLNLLFEPFYTTKEKGTGLGLAISYEIVKDHGGGITVESEPGNGARFTVELPTIGS